MTMTGPVGVVSRAIATLACVFLFEGRATTVGGMRSASVDSAACLGNATAASPMDKRVSVCADLLTNGVNLWSRHTQSGPTARVKTV